MSRIATHERGELLKTFYAILLVNCYAQQRKNVNFTYIHIGIRVRVVNVVDHIQMYSHMQCLMAVQIHRRVWELGASVSVQRND